MRKLSATVAATALALAGAGCGSQAHQSSTTTTTIGQPWHARCRWPCKCAARHVDRRHVERLRHAIARESRVAPAVHRCGRPRRAGGHMADRCALRRDAAPEEHLQWLPPLLPAGGRDCRMRPARRRLPQACRRADGGRVQLRLDVGVGRHHRLAPDQPTPGRLPPFRECLNRLAALLHRAQINIPPHASSRLRRDVAAGEWKRHQRRHREHRLAERRESVDEGRFGPILANDDRSDEGWVKLGEIDPRTGQFVPVSAWERQARRGWVRLEQYRPFGPRGAGGCAGRSLRGLIPSERQTASQRRGGDSNPRTRSTPVTRFPVAPVQPLRHLSVRRAKGSAVGDATAAVFDATALRSARRRRGAAAPRRHRARCPVTATSFDPIMKSMWSSLRLIRC